VSYFPSIFLVGGIALATLSSVQAGALELDGTGDYVTFPNEGIPSGDEPFTIEAWVNPDVHSDSTITFWGNQNANQANGFRLKAGGTTRHYFWGNDHDTSSTGDLSSNSSGPNSDGWHHLAITWNGSQTQWYWNGSTLEGPRSANGVNVANTNHRIGSRLDAEYFDGLIDEVRIWDKARSGAEIASDYQEELSGGEANLIAYFNFENDFGDRAGGDNDGTPLGDASINAAQGAPVGSVGGPVIQSFTANPPALFEGETSTLAWDIDTDEVAGSLVVEILAPGGGLVNTSSSPTGSFPLLTGDTGGAAQTLTYTLRARETGGAMLSRESTLEIVADPGIPSASAQSLETVTTTPLAITLTGNDPNNHPNPLLAFSIVTPPGGGTLSGTAPDLNYTANAGFTGTDSFTFKSDDGKYDSSAAAVVIEVVPAESSPTDIELSTLNIGENVLDGGFVATLMTGDVNVDDTHSYSLVAGAGDADNTSFSIVGNQLRAATGFAGQAGTTFSIRLRTLDSSGRSYEESFTLTVVMVSDGVVINEIHYNPPENPVRQEYIELHNPSNSAAVLDGWRLTGAVNFVFPGGISIPPGGFLVVAEDPETLQSTLNADALGPFSGSLSSDGETVRLRDANDNVIDEVDYRVGFPWPVASDGGGASIELVNPSLDNSLGSSWRASIPQTLLGEATLLEFADHGWSWRPGETEASTPISDWRDQSFVEDGEWNPNAQAPIGYGSVNGVPLNTAISGMVGNYSCVFLRNRFEIAPGEIPNLLELNYTADDGFVIWINGVEVERRRFDENEDPTIDDTASGSGTEGVYETGAIINPGAFLVEGSNTIAVQLFNATLSSSDLGFDLQVFRPAEDGALPVPSPGAENTAFASNAPPNIRKVNHVPSQPGFSDPVVITAKVTDPEGVASVNLEYQVVSPGNYIPAYLPHPPPNIPTNVDRSENPEYEDDWISVSMLDDGTGGDALAGDDFFSATLPAQAHRTLVRYRITIEDGLGLAARVPYPDDASLNFAYFVYDGVPAYEGNSADVMANTLPVYHLLTRAEDYSDCIAYNSGDRIQQGTQGRFFYNWNGTIVYDGEVYDNIRYRLRGANGRYQSTGKRSMRFRLNEGRFLQARDHFGKKFSQKWRTLTLGKCSSNRLTLTHGLNEAVNFYLFNKIGVPGAHAQWLHWRVIDEADEDPDRSGGDFHGFYLNTETYDVRFLEEHGLAKGNLYKLINQTGDWEQQQRYQAAFAPSDGADHNTIEQQLDGGDTADYIRNHVNLDKWTRSHALVQAIRHYDYWPSANKNMVYYFEPDYLPGDDGNNNKGKLWVLPWDTDATWGPTYNSGHDVVYNSLFASSGGGSDGNSTPELWPAYYNQVREIRDLLWQPEQIEPLIDEFASFIGPLEAADASRWENSPAADGNYGGLHGAGKISLAAYVQDMKNFAFVGGSWDGGGVGAGGRASDLDRIQGQNGEAGKIPDTPTITYTGSAEYLTNGISFQSSAFTDPQGNGSFAAMEWRIAQITDPEAPNHDPEARFKLEIEADWESGEITTFDNSIEIPTIAVRSGLTYRARVRHLDSTGRWSHWSAPVEFTTTLPDISDYLAGLVVTEVMYHPAEPSAAEITAGFDDDDFEFIELKNVGNTTLDLKDLRFTKGVDFDFLGAAITTLEPGEFVLVVNDLAAFEMRYGAGLPVAGVWESSDKLDNGGERVKLSFGAGDPIRDFTYDDVAPWPTTPDGQGPSLTLQAPETVPDHTLATSWTAGSSNGTPGMDEAAFTYQIWTEAIFGPGNPPGSGELDDPDLDGVVNLLEYSGGTDPLSAGSAPITTVGVIASGADDFLTITYTRRRDRVDLSYLVEVSTDLVVWNSGPSYTAEVGPPVDRGDGSETITVRSLIPLATDPRQFLHLAVERQ